MFITLSLLSRVCSGCAFSLVYTSGLACITRNFPNEREKYISIGELGAGIGLIGVPTVVPALYNVFGFSVLFIALSFLLILILPFTIKVIPDGKWKEDPPRTNLFYHLKNSQLVLDLVEVVYVNMSLLYMDHTVGIFIYRKGYDDAYVGLGFILSLMCYILTCVFMIFYQKLLTQHSYMLLSIGLCTTGLFFVGGLEFFLDESLIAVYVGMCLTEIGGGLCFIVAISSMLKETKGDSSHNETVCGLFAMATTAGEVLGPQLSSNLVYLFGFRISSLLISILGLIVFFLYIMFRRRSSSQLTDVFLHP